MVKLKSPRGRLSKMQNILHLPNDLPHILQKSGRDVLQITLITTL